METKVSTQHQSQHDGKPPVVGSASNKPHCWGKMKWILKYPSGMEPPTSVCRCEHGSLKCKLLTRQAARQHCP